MGFNLVRFQIKLKFIFLLLLLCPMKSNIVFVAEGGLRAGIRAHRGPLVQVNDGGCG